ncbi:MAG TPA: STAS domain-containing protein [Actinospica sp.]|nr:STAS domain-containing protein [Actinospica sp.]
MSGEAMLEVGIRTDEDCRIAILTVAAELDVATSPLLCSAVDKALVYASLQLLILDLSGLLFIDAAGLGALVRARVRAHEQAASLLLVGASPRVLRLLRITRLIGSFPICATLADVGGAIHDAAIPGADSDLFTV